MKGNRKDLILKYIVEEFVHTAEPVSSKALLEKYDLKCSSATIRNTMVELENEGLIEKTHTSSGRIPSAKAYQYYLDHLDKTDLINSVNLEFQREFKNNLYSRAQSVEEVLSKSCQMLSDLTNTATLVLGPKANDEKLVSVQLLRLNDVSAMGIFITDSGYVEKQTFLLEQSNISFDDACKAVSLFNDRLKGTKISDLPAKAKALTPIISKMCGQSGEVVIQSFVEALMTMAKKRIKIYGTKNLLSLPEFNKDTSAFINAIDTLNDPNHLEKNIEQNDDLGSVKVGFTNSSHGDLCIVTKQIKNKDQIAVVGPRRMDYKKIVSALEYVCFMLARYFASDIEINSNALIPVEDNNIQEKDKEIKNEKRKERNARKRDK